MPRGGKRRGSGRKPKTARVLPMPGVTVPAVAALASAADPVVTCPADVGEAVAEVWAELAPMALERGTLTAATARGFRVMCEVFVEYHTVRAQVNLDGYTFADQFGNPKSNPLLVEKGRLLLRLEQLLARFGCLPDGKVAAARPAPEVNPWAAIGPGIGGVA